MNISIILGTAREGRQSEKVANFILSEVKKAGHNAELIDVKDFLHLHTDNTQQNPKLKEYAQKIIDANAVIIVSPEYNHGYPGELKLLLDSAYKEYFGKKVGFVGVSAGPLGGARVIEQLRQVVIELRMIPIREALYFSLITQGFDEKAYETRIKVFLEDLTK